MEVVPTPDPMPPSRDDDLSWRLASLESRVDAITERLGRLEATVRDAVAQEVRGATAELRRAMSELGRRLVQDLPHELARHRDAIIAELRPPPPPPPPEPQVEAEPEHEEPPTAACPNAMEVVELVEPATVIEPAMPETPEAARRRASRLRRRHG